MIKYWLFRLAQFMACQLPERYAYRLAEKGADIYSVFVPQDRRSVRNNLRVITGAEPSNQQVDEVFRNFGRYLIDFFRQAKFLNKDFLEQRIKFEGREHVEAALARGKGAILLTAHFGSWELGGAMLAQSGFPMHAIALSHPHKQFNDWFNKQRETLNLKPICVSNARQGVIKCLRDNQCVAIVADRDYTGNGIKLPFFTSHAIFPRGPAVFALKTDAAILPTFFRRNDDGTFTMHIDAPIAYDVQKLNAQAIESVMTEYIKSLEGAIAKDPEQWLVFPSIFVEDNE